MRRRSAPVVAAALCALWLWPAVAAAQSQRARPLFGFNDLALFTTSHSPGAILALAKRVGAETMRLTVQWRVVEPTPGHWTWTVFDRVVGDITAAGLRPLVIVGDPPDWATDRALLDCSLLASGPCRRPPDPAHYGAWAEFVRRTVERYPNAIALEVYNEPNYGLANWRPRADPFAYTQVLARAFRAARSVRAGLPVLSGGLLNNPTDSRQGNLDAITFLSEMYRAGAKGYMDGIAIHPYDYPFDPRPPGSAYHVMLDALRAIRDAAGDGSTPFWITETGYPTSSDANGVSPALQAVLLPAIVDLGLHEPDVKAVFVQSLVDTSDRGPEVLDSHFGIVDAQLQPKPAFAALAAIIPVELRSAAVPRTLRSHCPSPSTTLGCPTGGVLHFRISEPASVRFSFRPRRGGVRSIRRRGTTGDNSFRFSGRIRRLALPRGFYTVTVTAFDDDGRRSRDIVRSVRVT